MATCAPGLVKRVVDLSIATVATVVLFPVWLLVAVAVKLDSPGPVFFRGERVGRGQRPFRMLKFRTMTHVAPSSEPDAIAAAAANAARITRLGRHLRRTKLDELPQLLNVLLGDMSLVGPRPESARYVPFYSDDQLRLFNVRPGMTGLAQLAVDEESLLIGHDDPEAAYLSEFLPRKLDLDLRYLQAWSVVLDLEILLCTAVRLVSGSMLVPARFTSLRQLVDD